MHRERVRIRFRKSGDLRWISHHDLMRCFERMLRRAALPFRNTAGFNPHPRLVFAQPLPLGIVGTHEIVDLELTESLLVEEVRDRLAVVSPPGLEILGVDRVDGRATVQPRAAVYRMAVPSERCSELTARANALLTADACWVVRLKPEERRLDVRPFLRDIRLVDGTLELHLLITPQGSARPEEVLRQLGLDDLLDAGAVLERLNLEFDELPAVPGTPTDPKPTPPVGPTNTTALPSSRIRQNSGDTNTTALPSSRIRQNSGDTNPNAGEFGYGPTL